MAVKNGSEKWQGKMAVKNGREKWQGKKASQDEKKKKIFFPWYTILYNVQCTVGLNNSLSQKMYICNTYYLGCNGSLIYIHVLKILQTLGKSIYESNM